MIKTMLESSNSQGTYSKSVLDVDQESGWEKVEQEVSRVVSFYDDIEPEEEQNLYMKLEDEFDDPPKWSLVTQTAYHYQKGGCGWEKALERSCEQLGL